MSFSNSSGLSTLKNFYNFVFYDLTDVRTQHWFLIMDPMPGFGIIAAYLIFVLHLGPKMMKNKKPYDLRQFLVVYNLAQVLFNAYLFLAACNIYLVRNLMSIHCTPVDKSTSPDAMFVAHNFYLYFIAKLSELLDTVFFVLRKKDNQVTFLHVYHHTVMLALSWGGVKYFPGGHGMFLGMINTFIHVIMYSYYFLAALGPHMQKYLWWKKYITVLQMLQFGFLTYHFGKLLVYDCGYPEWVSFLIVPNATLFSILFRNFYRETYKSKSAASNSNGICMKTSTKND